MIMNTAPQQVADASGARACVLYVKGGREHRTAWFTCGERARRALGIMRKRYGAAVIYRD